MKHTVSHTVSQTKHSTHMEQLLHRTADESTYYAPQPGISLLRTTTNNDCSGHTVSCAIQCVSHTLSVSHTVVLQHVACMCPRCHFCVMTAHCIAHCNTTATHTGVPYVDRIRMLQLPMTVSTKIATSPTSTESRNSDFSVSCGTNSNRDFSLCHREKECS